MKSMRRQDDSEFRRRLFDYSEEPDEDLWREIAAQLTRATPLWIMWARHLSAVIIALSTAVFMGADIPGAQDLKNIEKHASTSGSNLTASANRSCLEDRTAVRRVSAEAHEDYSDPANSAMTTATWLPTTPPSERQELSNRLFQIDLTVASQKTFDIGQLLVAQTSDSMSAVQPVPSSQQLNKKGKLRLFPLSHDVYVTVMPALGYQRIKSNRSDNILIQEFKPIPAFSRDRLGIRLEAGLETIGHKRWKAYCGVLYYQLHQTLEYVEKRVDSLISVPETSGGVLEPRFSLVSGSMDYDIKNVGLHFGLSYRIWDKERMDAEPGADISGKNLALQSTRRFLHEIGGGIELHKSLKPANPNAESFANPSLYAFFNFYYSIQYPRTGRLKAVLRPTLNYAFYVNRDASAPFYVKPYGLGLNLGCRYHL